MQGDRARGVDRPPIEQTGAAKFQVDGAVDVAPFAIAGLVRPDCDLLGRPVANRSRRMGGGTASANSTAS